MELTFLHLDDAAPIEVGPGCIRRDLPAPPGVRAWVVDIAPGAQWPYPDVHDGPELVYVVEGELLEGSALFGPGSYLKYALGTEHRPRSLTGVRLFGINLR